MAKPVPFRKLDYANLDEMLADVDDLLQYGYERSGNWTLGQAAGHVAEWISFPMDGFPTPPLLMRSAFRVMRVTGVAQRMAKNILADGFKPGTPTAPVTVPDASYSDQAGVARLRAVVQQLKQFDGPLQESPLFGPLDHATHVRVSLLHGAHHFGFLKPNSQLNSRRQG